MFMCIVYQYEGYFVLNYYTMNIYNIICVVQVATDLLHLTWIVYTVHPYLK